MICDLKTTKMGSEQPIKGCDTGNRKIRKCIEKNIVVHTLNVVDQLIMQHLSRVKVQTLKSRL